MRKLNVESLTKLLPHKLRTSRYIKLPSDSGIGPVKLLPESSSILSLEEFEIAGEIKPLKLFPPQMSTSILGIAQPKPDGRVPESLLCAISRTSSDDMLKMFAGTEPLNRLSDNPSACSFFRLPSSTGISPVIDFR